jgi:crotonobetainyl-CoA:carnitine CoA-transferase CaiB-like acyl-CoA transferase
VKSEAGRAIVLQLAARPTLIEGFRPGVMERLGLDPTLSPRSTRSWCSAA